MPSKPQVFLVEPLSQEFEDVLRQQTSINYFSNYDEGTLIKEIPAADAVIIRSKGRITRRVLQAAPKLRVIGRHGVGVDHIDLVAAKQCQVTVVNTPLANYRSTAEFTVGLMLCATRHIVQGDSLVRQERPWTQANQLVGTQLQGKRLGVVGMGRIGRTVAAICGLGFGMSILYHDYKSRIWTPPLGVQSQSCSLDELLSNSDVVTLHVPLSEPTYHLLNKQRLFQMKSSAYLINTGRGQLIDEQSLIECLERGHLAGAALDVMEVEPLTASHLTHLPNVVLTPHMAAYSEESLVAMGAVVLDLLRVLRGEAPQYPVL